MLAPAPRQVAGRVLEVLSVALIQRIISQEIVFEISVELQTLDP